MIGATALLGTLACAGAPARPLSELTPGEWEQDLAAVLHTLEEEHPDPLGYHGVDPVDFRTQAETAHEAILSGAAERIVLELDRLVAMGGDGHTSLDAVQPRAGLSRLPLGAQFFGDELWIHSVAPGLEGALGARVLALDGVETRAALDSVSRLIAHDNPQEFVYAGSAYLLTPVALAFSGVADGNDTISLRLSRRDSVFDLRIGAWSTERLASVDWVRARPADAPPPLRLSRSAESYWFEHLPDANAIYVYWDRVDDADSGPSLRRFYAALFETIDRTGVDRLIVDLRQNNGGNYHKADDFVAGVVARPRIAREGGVYVLTGPRTFSAATHLVARLRREAHALVVGEISRGNPNRTYNAETLVLGRSGLHMEYTERLEDPPPFPELGDLRHVPVDLPAYDSFRDYLAGRDAVLDVALRHRW